MFLVFCQSTPGGGVPQSQVLSNGLWSQVLSDKEGYSSSRFLPRSLVPGPFWGYPCPGVPLHLHPDLLLIGSYPSQVAKTIVTKGSCTDFVSRISGSDSVDNLKEVIFYFNLSKYCSFILHRQANISSFYASFPLSNKI